MVVGVNAGKTKCNHTATDHKEGEQLEDRRNVGESSCNSGDGTDQRVHSLMFMMMKMMMMITKCMFVSCGWNAVQDHATTIGNKSVATV
jgi:hypothetical protein